MDFNCWKCGFLFADEPMPLGREVRCRACGCDVHVCRQCQYYDPSRAKSCAEPVADEVRDKERANFCGYFAINVDAHAGSAEADAARQRLQSLFGVAGDDGAGDGPMGQSQGESRSESEGESQAEALARRRRDEADAARDELSRLFGLDDK